MFMRRRPLMRAAMVGGGAYYAGKRAQERAYREDEQEARLAELEAQPAGVARPPTPTAGGLGDAAVARLQQLGQLHADGVLTDEEFTAAKQQILGI